jgi:carboxyl-terminal processing protease
MPPRNLNIILLTCFVSAFCYVTHRHTGPALFVSDALSVINRTYVDAIDEAELLTAAMNGMTSKLDEHSEYIPPSRFETFQHNITQEFAGIGIFVELPDDGPPVRVVTPLVGSPALSAGMLPGDRIVRIDDEDVSAMDLAEVSGKLKGPIGTQVNVTVRRDQQDVVLRISRATIELESVIGDHRDPQNQWVFRLADDPSIAYVRLTSFGEKTVAELQAVLQSLDNDFDGLILDLRANGGGLLETAIGVSDMFLEEGQIVSTRTRGGVLAESFAATPGTLVRTDKPIVVLIDGNSASASEIVAACLQDHGRASIVGERSYGKGTVQNVVPLQYGHSALRLTVARFYRPSGENLHRSKDATEDQPWGVRPDAGLAVSLDAESRLKLVQRWAAAAYPALGSLQHNGVPPAASAVDPEQGSLESDPALRRAVDHLAHLPRRHD